MKSTFAVVIYEMVGKQIGGFSVTEKHKMREVPFYKRTSADDYASKIKLKFNEIVVVEPRYQ